MDNRTLVLQECLGQLPLRNNNAVFAEQEGASFSRKRSRESDALSANSPRRQHKSPDVAVSRKEVGTTGVSASCLHRHCLIDLDSCTGLQERIAAEQAGQHVTSASLACICGIRA